MADYVVYKRVSTAKQGSSGLGLEGQAKAVSDYLRPTDRIVAEFVEIETGKRADRPQLALAIERAKLTGAKILVAKLDRLARNLHFIATLMETKVRFVAADMPDANDLTVHILAAVAEAEAKMISHRTTVALAAAKARGQALGNDGSNLRNQAQGLRNSGVVRTQKADSHAACVAKLIDQARSEGVQTLRAVAGYLNARSIQTPRGSRWTPTAVKRVLDRVDHHAS